MYLMDYIMDGCFIGKRVLLSQSNTIEDSLNVTANYFHVTAFSSKCTKKKPSAPLKMSNYLPGIIIPASKQRYSPPDKYAQQLCAVIVALSVSTLCSNSWTSCEILLPKFKN